MRGNSKDTLWLFLGVILLFGVMATFSPGSRLGGAFLSLRGSIEDAFGGGTGYCPFINPYAMSIYSAGELVITGAHPLCDPVEYTLAENGIGDFEEGIDYPEISGGEVVTEGDNSCKDTYTVSINQQDDEDVSTDVSIKWTADDEDFSESMTQDEFFGSLSALQQVDIDSSNEVAIQLLTEKRPMWQCFFIFGLLPFFIIYYLLNDILTFAYLRTNTRRLIAIFAALLTVLTGSFANLVVAVSNFVGLSVGGSFLMAIFSLAVISVLLGQLTVTAGVAQSTMKSVQKAVEGALVLTNVARATGGPEGQDER